MITPLNRNGWIYWDFVQRANLAEPVICYTDEYRQYCRIEYGATV